MNVVLASIHLALKQRLESQLLSNFYNVNEKNRPQRRKAPQIKKKSRKTQQIQKKQQKKNREIKIEESKS